MFTHAGPVSVVIGEVVTAEPKFSKGANDFDICLRVTAADDSSQTDWARLEVSQDYGKGNFSDRTQAQITADTLRKLGFEGADFTTIGAQLTGKTATVMVKESVTEKGTFYNVSYFVTGGQEPVALDPAALKAKMAALFGDAGEATGATPTPSPAPTPPPKPATAAANPFGPKAGTPPAGARPNPFAPKAK